MRDATTLTTVREDGPYRRTALIVETGSDNQGSIDVIARAPHGDYFVGRINIFVTEDGMFMVDVIDTDERFAPARALVFPRQGEHGSPRQMIEGGVLVGAHFELKGSKR